MNEEDIRKKMTEVLDLVASDIASLRTGRATPKIVEDLQVAVYGGQQKLTVKELATISTPDPQVIILDPWDKSIIGEIKKGIEAANVGLTPVVSSQGGTTSGRDGEIIRISIPPMTTEDRNKYIKLLKGKLENGRVMIRQVRSEAMKVIRRSFEDKDLSEDEKFNQEKRLQKVTDEFIEKIEKVGKKKEQELLQI
jgi:ribosome recycling factor